MPAGTLLSPHPPLNIFPRPLTSHTGSICSYSPHTASICSYSPHKGSICRDYISPLPPHPPRRFLLQHAKVLAIGTLTVMALKATLVTATVSWFGFPWRTSLAVGLTMAHVGEFAFVLLSASVDLNILPQQVGNLRV